MISSSANAERFSLLRNYSQHFHGNIKIINERETCLIYDQTIFFAACSIMHLWTIVIYVSFPSNQHVHLDCCMINCTILIAKYRKFNDLEKISVS